MKNSDKEISDRNEFISQISVTAINTSICGIITINQFGKIVQLNSVIESLFEYEKGELLGENINILTPDKYTVNHDNYINNYIETGIKKLIGIGREVEGKKKDGSLFPIYLEISESTNIDNQIYFVGIIRDLTKLKETQKELNQNLHNLKELEDLEHNLSDLYEKNPDMQASIDIKTGKIIRCNETLLQVTGYKKNELIGYRPFKLYDSKSIGKAKRSLKEFSKKGVIRNVELNLKRKDGKIIPISLNATAIRDNSGKIIYSSSTLRDISILKKTENKLIQANHIKNEFLAKISHEIKNQLSIVEGFVSLLSLGNDYDITTRHNYLNMLQHSTEQLSNLISNSLDVSSLAENKVKLLSNNFDLHLLGTTISLAYKEIAKNKKLNFLFNIFTDKPYFVIGDNIRIKQILSNLLNNAVKYTEVGTVSLSIQLIKIRKDEINKCRIRFTVSDTGIGIPEDKINFIFENFSRVDNKHSKGFGLGLAISKELVELMKGKLEVKSEIGNGSEFNFELTLSLD